jgi:lysophospholipase L1-like esterase
VLVLIGIALSLVACESGLRMYRWRHAPLRLRLLYAAFLLSDEAVEGIAQINQRVERAGLRSFEQLFALYATASGKTPAEIEALFGFAMPWHRLNRSKLVLRNRLQWHIGLTPVPGQRLRTATIGDAGRRSTGLAKGARVDGERGVRRVLVTGGSVAYGYGATNDRTTIPGQLEDYLNQRDPAGRTWEVINGAFPGGNSFQELIVALQHDDATTPVDYIVSISGCNDVDQQFGFAQASVSALAHGYRTGLERTSLWRQVASSAVRRILLLAAMQRWLLAYRQWPGLQEIHRRGSATQEIEGPDIYPLW